MKKLNYLLLGAAGLLMASCSNEDVKAPMADGNFTVRIQLPADMATRATVTPTTTQYGQGYAAKKLYYIVYECDAAGTITKYVTEGDTSFPDGVLETEVGFSLANGKYYQLAFFAESADAADNGVYVIDTNEKTIKVNYEKMDFETNNVDGYDCFYRLYATGQIGAAGTNTSPTVYLYRPVAQINWGTNDYDKATVIDTNAFGPNPANTIQTLFSAQVYDTFDMVTGTVKGGRVEHNFKAMNVPNTYTFPVSGYNYLAMQYVLAPAATDNTQAGGYVYDLNLNVKSNVAGHNISVVVNNAPVQANWRTNIYGALLTDNFEVKVVKEPLFWGEYNLPQPAPEEGN